MAPVEDVVDMEGGRNRYEIWRTPRLIRDVSPNHQIWFFSLAAVTHMHCLLHFHRASVEFGKGHPVGRLLAFLF